jgi:tetratricopeptide (TPR) repeat protein
MSVLGMTTPQSRRPSSCLRSLLVVAVVATLCPRPGLAQDSTGAPRCAVATDEVSRLWCEGSALFIQGTPAGYAKAIGPYSRALGLEKKQRVLGRNAWLVLIDNLGIAYGITGDLPKARATFEYGLSREPTYPMFYYNMACFFAESGDEAKAIENLNHAFALRGNMIPNETMPDPATDDSFQRFMHSPTFIAALKNLPGRAP